MKYDVILAGVGGQGVLTLAASIAYGAMQEGLTVRQSEVHGMAQRGGAVLAHMRLADSEIYGDLIGKGSADMILSMEPMEGLRYLEYLKPDGILISAAEPFENIPNYPEPETLYDQIRQLPSQRLIETKDLAKQAGSVRAVNMVLIGAASPFLPISKEKLSRAIADLFERKGADIVKTNQEAFSLGRKAAEK